MQPQRIVFDGHSGIGDTMQYIAALLSLRAMYPHAQILLTTNSIGKMLLGLNHLVDRIAIVWHEGGSADPQNLQRFVQQAKYFTVDPNASDDRINDPKLPPADLIVCVERNKELLNAALSTGAKVVSFYTLMALTRKNLKLVLPFSRKNMHEMERYQRLVRGCNRHLYESTFPRVDLTQVRLKPPAEQQSLVDAYLKEYMMQYAHDSGKDASSLKHLVLINPLSHTAERDGFNLKHSDYVALGEMLAEQYPQCLFVLSSFGDQDFHHIPRKAPNLKLFINPSNILALLVLVHRSSLVIAPSTGTSHFADNQSIDLCGFYSQFDFCRWGANGLQKLANLQAQLRHSSAPELNGCAYTVVNTGWEQHYETYRYKFFVLCDNFIIARTLTLSPKLPALLEQH